MDDCMRNPLPGWPHTSAVLPFSFYPPLHCVGLRLSMMAVSGATMGLWVVGFWQPSESGNTHTQKHAHKNMPWSFFTFPKSSSSLSRPLSLLVCKHAQGQFIPLASALVHDYVRACVCVHVCAPLIACSCAVKSNAFLPLKA